MTFLSPPRAPSPAARAPLATDVLRALFEAIRSSDEVGVGRLLASDIQIDVVGPVEVALFGYSSGITAAIDRLRWWREHVLLDRIEWYDVATEPARIVVSGVIEFRVQHTQRAVSTPWMLALTLGEGAITHAVAYVDSAAVREAFFPTYVALSSKLRQSKRRRRG